MSDLDLSLSPVKKNVAKQGRRAPGGWSDAGDGLEDQKNSWAELSTKNDNDELFAETTRHAFIFNTLLLLLNIYDLFE